MTLDKTRQANPMKGTKATDTTDYAQEHVLIVDDDDAARRPLVEKLRMLGFQVKEAGNGAEALKELENGTHTVLLTDMKMPGLDGFELIEETSSRWPDLCVIAMTGFSRSYSYVSVIKAGATDFIKKPFSIEEIEAKIKRAITERNIRRELSRLSITDSLTGLYNQRHFYDHLKREILRGRRQHHPLSLILMDLDHFKAYNDTHGHLAGDSLLQRVGAIIQASIRQGVDSGYRYGGDEFAIILIDADHEITEGIARRIGDAIEKECGITASVGCATYVEDMTVEDLVKLADERVYRSKRQRQGQPV